VQFSSIVGATTRSPAPAGCTIGWPRVRAQANRGRACANKRDFDQAIADYNEALRPGPKDASGSPTAAPPYASKREFDLGIADYGEALRRQRRCGYREGQATRRFGWPRWLRRE
jgi:tetratricopeptide (TPR) repeat protein